VIIKYRTPVSASELKANNPLRGRIGEVMVFDGPLSVADRQAVNQYWNRKWGIEMDSDGDRVPDGYDLYPADPLKVVDLPALLAPLSSTLKVWLTASGNHNRDTDTNDPQEAAVMPVMVRNELVGTWYDWSGNNNHMMSVGSQRPRYVPTGLNGRSALQFDGINDQLSGSAPLLAGDDSYTVCVVWQTASTANQVVWEQNSLTGTLSGQRAALTTGTLIGFDGQGYVFPSGNMAVPNSQNITCIIRNENATAGNVFIVNNGVVSTGNLNDNPDTNLAVAAAVQLLGRQSNQASYLNGMIGEVMVFDRDLTTLERGAVETYLDIKWNGGFDSDGDGIPNAMDMTPTVAMTITQFVPRDNSIVSGDWLGVSARPVDILSGTVRFQLPIDHTTRLSLGASGNATLMVSNGMLSVGTLELGLAFPSQLLISGGAVMVTGNLRVASSSATITIGNRGRLVAPLMTVSKGPADVLVNDGDLTIGTMNVSSLTIKSGLVQAGFIPAASNIDLDQGVLYTGGTTAGIVNRAGMVGGAAFPSVIRVGGSYTQQANGQLVIRVGYNGLRLVHDQLVVAGDADFAGTVTVVTINEVVLQEGDRLDILDVGGNVSGRIDTLQLPPLGGALEYDTSKLLTTGIIRVVDTSDTDQDGVPDARDEFPEDPSKVSNAFANQLLLAPLSGQSKVLLWLDASSSNAMELESGRVKKWYDLSGNRRHFTQSTVGNRPSFNIGLNGLGSIQISTPNMAYLMGQDGESLAGFNTTVLAVMRWDGPSGVASTASIISKTYDKGTFGMMVTWVDGVPRLMLSNTSTRAMDMSSRNIQVPMVVMADVAPDTQTLGFNGIEIASANMVPESGAKVSLIGLSESASANVLSGSALPAVSNGATATLIPGTGYYGLSFVLPGSAMVTFSMDVMVDVLVIGGGGGGGFNAGGGGGAGAVVFYPNIRFKGGQGYTITVGAGGAGGTSGTSPVVGNDSQIAMGGVTIFRAQGGGAGGNVGTNGTSGGSGGGGGGGYLLNVMGGSVGNTSVVDPSGRWTSMAPVNRMVAGNQGGNGYVSGLSADGGMNNALQGGGGGGAGGAGWSATYGSAGRGGVGVYGVMADGRFLPLASVFGSLYTSVASLEGDGAHYVAGGGGGGGHCAEGIGLGGLCLGNGLVILGGRGGAGSGIDGSGSVATATSAKANTGSGGGGGRGGASNGGAGASGMVLIRFKPSSFMFPLNAQLGEVMVFERLASADRLVVEQYLMAKWGIISLRDSDGDGIPDNRDAFPKDPNKAVDLAVISPQLDALSDAAKSSLKWWVSATLNALELDASNGVSRWYDYSGGRRHLTPVSGTRPVMNPLGINAMPAVQFVGAGRLGFDGSFLVGRPYTVFIVENTTISASNSWILFGSGDAVASNLVFGYSNATTLTNQQFRDGSTGYSYSYTIPTALQSKPLLHTFAYSQATNKQAYLNGPLLNTTTQWNGYLSSFANAGFGGTAGTWTSPWQGTLGEVMIFDTVLSESDRLLVTAYLATKWKVVVDSDGDGVPDYLDQFPSDRSSYVRFAEVAPTLNRLSDAAKQQLILWAPPVNPSTVQLSAQGRISTWYDWSNRGNHLTAISDATAPVQEVSGCGAVPQGASLTMDGPHCVLSFTVAGTTSWRPPVWVSTADVLVVAGGGGGGYRHGGGGGAGGLLYTQNMAVTSNQSYSVSVGAGGSAATGTHWTSAALASNGGNSVFGSLTAIGGGAGATNARLAGAAGGSGGGGVNGTLGGAGTAGQGYRGGNQNNGNGCCFGFGTGGGGAGAAAADTTGSAGSAGGIGVLNAITGTPTYYAGGGGGGNWDPVITYLGGRGGGGNGGNKLAVGLPTPGLPNTGGGGGGGGADSGATENGAGGGSGIVVVRFLSNPTLGSQAMVTFNGVDRLLNVPFVTARSYTAYVIMRTQSPGAGVLSDGAFLGAPLLTGHVIGIVNDVIPLSLTEGYVRTFVGNPDSTLGTSSSACGAVPAGAVLTMDGTACVLQFTTVGNNAWTPPTWVNAVDALIVGGGGGGGGGTYHGAGGGGGVWCTNPMCRWCPEPRWALQWAVGVVGAVIYLRVIMAVNPSLGQARHWVGVGVANKW